MSASGSGTSGGMRIEPLARIKYNTGAEVGSFGSASVVKPYFVRLVQQVARSCRSTPDFWATAEWQFTVAHDGSVIDAEMNDHFAGRSSVALPQPSSAATAAASRTSRGPGSIGGGLCINVFRAQPRMPRAIVPSGSPRGARFSRLPEIRDAIFRRRA